MRAAFHDRTLVHHDDQVGAPANASRFMRNPMLDMLVTSDDIEVEKERHEQKRVLYTKSFAARRVIGRKVRVENIANAKIDAIIAAGAPVDLHDTYSMDYSMDYSQQALCDMVGILEEDGPSCWR